VAKDEISREGRSIAFGEASALVAVIAVGVYILGLVALWVPISVSYTHDLAASWHAVSLVPRTTVVGQGVTVIAPPLLGQMVPLLALPLLGVLVTRALEKRIRAVRQGSSRALPLVSAIFVSFVILGLLIALFGFWFFLTFGGKEYIDLWEWMAVLIMPIAVLATGSWLKGSRRPRSAEDRLFEEGSSLPEPVRGGSPLRVAALLGSMLFATALVIGAFRDPPLPAVEITGDNHHIEGNLLTHTDRFWYVFDQEGVLVVLPDMEVTEVRIIPDD
jgi:hypothetical protein